MRGRLLGAAVVLVVLLAGCVSPGAQLDAGAVGALDAVAIEGALAERLPNGDLRLVLKGETDGRESFEFDVPEGVTFVEAAVTTAPGAPFSPLLVDAESGAPMCWPQRHQAWYVPVEDEVRCTALGVANPGRAWKAHASSVSGLLKPFTLTLTFSTQPLDGSAANIKLDQLSRVESYALPTESFKVPSSADGALLHVEVTRPAVDGKVPVILVASPYNTADRMVSGIANEPLVKFATARGYAVATMDLRGTGISGGCFSMRGAVDQTDVADAVEWLGTQDWSNGKVGMYGISYEGFTPVAAAVQQPEHLAAIFIGAPAVDMYANYRPGGVETGRTFSTGVLGYVVGSAAQTTDDPENPLGPLAYRADAACDPDVVLGNDPRMTYDAWWKARNLTELADRITVPVHLEQGFWDNPVKSNAIADLFPKLAGPKRAVLGSWEHIWALRADEQLRFLAWMDHWLKGRDTGIMDGPVVEVLTNTRMWRAADEWPATDAVPVEVPLQAGAYASTAAHLVPSPLGDAIETVTEPYPEGLYVSGVPSLALDVTLPRGGNTYLHAELYEEDADGERRIVIMGWRNAAHKDGHATYAPFAPGESRALDMQLLPVEHVVKPGSRLVLVLRSTDAQDSYGGPEGGVTETPGVVQVAGGALRLPTLPLDALSPPPRSAS